MSRSLVILMVLAMSSILPAQNQPPTITITSPVEGAVFIRNQNILIAGELTDDADDVEVWVIEQFSGTPRRIASNRDSNGVPISFSISSSVGTGSTLGEFELAIFARDKEGLESEHVIRHYSVINTPPTVTVPGLTMVGYSTTSVTLTISSKDEFDFRTNVQYRLNKGPVQFLNSVPATSPGTQNITVSPLKYGENSVEVRAFDSMGASTVKYVSVYREFPPAHIPVITSISKRVDRTSPILAQRPVTLYGTARDDQAVQAVLYRFGPAGGYLLAQGTETWTVSAGTFRGSIFLKAVDADGNESAVEEVLVEATPDESRDLFTLTPFGDIWASEWFGTGYTLGYLFASPYFVHDIPNGFKTMSGDFNGDGLTDFFNIDSSGRLRVATNTGFLGLNAPMTLSHGWRVDDANGFTVLAGKLNDDEFTDLMQIEPDGTVTVAFNSQGVLLPPALVANTSLRHDPENGRHLFLHPMFDSLDDLVETDANNNTIRIMQNLDGSFASPVSSATSLQHLPEDMKSIVFGDFALGNATGAAEINDSHARIAPGVTAGEFGDPILRTPGFHADPSRGEGWWAFAHDLTPFAGDDLVQITQFGDIWIAPSYLGIETSHETLDETSYNVSLKVGTLGFHHKPDGNWQLYFGNAR